MDPALLDSRNDSTPPAGRQAFRAVATLVSVGILVAVAIGAAQLVRRAPSEARAAPTPQGVTRTYDIAADEVDWDYTPYGRNRITGQPFDATADVFVKNGPDRIGSVYRKAQFREYTDATFHTLRPRAADDAYLGQLGPTIHAAVGDRITIVFRNNTSQPLGMHPHGVKYDKGSEGAPYNDGPGTERGDDAVPPGGTWTYHWTVPERAGPGPMDPSSVMWMYHSHTDEVADTYAGLMGAIIVTRAGNARPDGSPMDVDREFINLYEVINENASPYLDYNIHHFTGNPASVDPEDPGFHESNMMHSINGYAFGNQPMMKARVGERVRWYMMGMGTEVDLHTPHWHGNTVLANGMRTDVIGLLPAMMTVADMVPDNVGIWLLHCHVNDHISAGMSTRYQVMP